MSEIFIASLIYIGLVCFVIFIIDLYLSYKAIDDHFNDKKE